MNPTVTVTNSESQSHTQHQFYRHYSCYRSCCCCLFPLLSFMALLFLTSLLVIVLAVKPKKPHLDLTQVCLEYMATDASPNRPPGPAASPNIYLILRLALELVNPNGAGIRWGESRVTLMYGGTPLGRTTVAPFWQKPHSVKKVVATVDVDDVNLSNGDAADFARGALLNDRVELRVLTHVATIIRIFNLHSPTLQVSLNCVIVISPRKQSLTYKQCGFEGLQV